jgi:hypothetical protein
VGGHQDHRHIVAFLREQPQQVEPADVGQLQIEQDQVGEALAEEAQALAAGVGDRGAVAEFGQDVLSEHGTDLLAVVDNKNLFHAARSGLRRRSWRRARRTNGSGPFATRRSSPLYRSDAGATTAGARRFMSGCYAVWYHSVQWSTPMAAEIPWYVTEVPTVFVSLALPNHLIDVPMVKTVIHAHAPRRSRASRRFRARSTRMSSATPSERGCSAFYSLEAPSTAPSVRSEARCSSLRPVAPAMFIPA